jgi:hypothetical protein
MSDSDLSLIYVDLLPHLLSCSTTRGVVVGQSLDV